MVNRLDKKYFLYEFQTSFRTNIIFLYASKGKIEEYLLKDSGNDSERINMGISGRLSKHHKNKISLPYFIGINSDVLGVEDNMFYAILSHEVTHCTFARLNDLGINTKDDEIICSLQTDILFNILTKLKGKKRETRNGNL
jgi:hypothetical protein